MSVKKKPKSGPSKSDLLRLVKEIGDHKPPTISHLQSVREQAEQAVRDFEKTNEEYKRLRKAQDDAYKRWWQTREKRSSELSKLRQMILLHGPTPEVVRAITKLV